MGRKPTAGPVSMDAALRAPLVAQSELGVALCEADGVLAEVNPALGAMLGVGPTPAPAPPREGGTSTPSEEHLDQRAVVAGEDAGALGAMDQSTER